MEELADVCSPLSFKRNEAGCWSEVVGGLLVGLYGRPVYGRPDPVVTGSENTSLGRINVNLFFWG